MTTLRQLKQAVDSLAKAEPDQECEVRIVCTEQGELSYLCIEVAVARLIAPRLIKKFTKDKGAAP